MKSYRFYGDEMEVLGRRLDAARQARKNSTTLWSINYWNQVAERLLTQWRQLPILHDGDAKTTIIPRWTVDYEFYETSNPSEYVGVSDRVYHKFFRESVDLDASWHNHREARLAKAQY
jgi:hypothetical protein